MPGINNIINHLESIGFTESVDGVRAYKKNEPDGIILLAYVVETHIKVAVFKNEEKLHYHFTGLRTEMLSMILYYNSADEVVKNRYLCFLDILISDWKSILVDDAIQSMVIILYYIHVSSEETICLIKDLSYNPSLRKAPYFSNIHGFIPSECYSEK